MGMNPTPHGQVPASSAVLKAIREADMHLVRTGDDAFMLVPYQQAHVQNPAEIEHVAGDVSKNGAESNMAQQPAPSAASKAVLAAIRAASMQLVRTGDDAFMLVPYKVAAPQADSQPAMTPETVYAAIAHGDEEHRAWLLSALRAVWCGEAVPPVASPIANAATESQPAPDAWLVTGIYTKQAFPMHCSAMAFLNGLLSSDPDGGYKIVPLFIHQQTTAGACGCEEPPTNPGDTESGPEGEWYCETHPGQLMGHAGCGGAGIPACGRIPCLMNQLRLTKQQVRETGRMRDEMAAAVLRAARAPADSVLEDAALLKEARGALWQPANAALCERIDAYLDAARKQGANHD